MKLKQVIKLCNRNKTVTLYDRVDENGEVWEQYIGDGHSLYPLERMPVLRLENIPALFGIKSKDIHKWEIDRGVLSERYSVKDAELGELAASMTGLTVDAAGVKVMALQAEGQIIWVDTAYIAPVEDDDQLFFFLRANEEGEKYVVLKKGLELGGIIEPYPQSGWVEDVIRAVSVMLTREMRA